MKTILVTTDFSETSKNAAIYATRLAKHLGANIMLLHVSIPQESFNQSSVVLESAQEVNSSELQLDAIRSHMYSYGDQEVEINMLLLTGEFFSEMVNLCEEIHPYIVIMGSQGTTATERFLMGSNSVHAMRNLTWPLLTIPSGGKYSEIKKSSMGFEDFIWVIYLKIILRSF